MPWTCSENREPKAEVKPLGRYTRHVGDTHDTESLLQCQQLADFLGIPHQKLYAQLKDWRGYYLKEMLIRFMVKQAGEHLKPVLDKSAATRSRAGMTFSIDNSVMDRFGTLLRGTWRW